MAEKIICETTLDALSESRCLDITESGTPCRYRLVDCKDLVNAQKLIIYEYSEFPQVRYAAVSYVWRGNTPDADFDGLAFNTPIPQADGAEPGDPIGLGVLHEACVASMACGATHLWLDRLCIMQMSEEDKKWQISHMFKMYQSCHVCIVAPGGIQCLVRLDEETQWIHRGWTLQEAVAPPRVVVIFSWTLGPRRVVAGDIHGEIQEVTPLKSAMMSLSLIVNACTTGSLKVEKGDHFLLLEVKLFSSHPADRSYNDFPFWRQTRRVLSPNVGALARIMAPEFDQDIKDHSIWQSALMRTSSRPVDMVFSIMGLFGVTLSTANLEVSSIMENVYPVADALVPMPRGSMDCEGYITFTAKAIGLQSLQAEPVSTPSDSEDAEPTHVKAIDESWWKIQEDVGSGRGKAFAVLVGFFVGFYPGGTPAHDAKNIRAMIVEEHAQQKFHVRSYLMLSQKGRAWVRTWPELESTVGGSTNNTGEAVENSEVKLPVISSSQEQYLNNPGSQYNKVILLEDQVIRRARWAAPQKALENWEKEAGLEQKDG
ncbi:hypothetical protein TGAMA5MH_06812 [Trichoderma gamsii]|uniref:Heterokaryon incompatibility domain-containing protein n=1 Tax=Trichoderma gamsii TaxID=398673 RepID=A0A2K0T603_9HYPO|nr:hypothetical protein TGAMA5MH_06812 [Trichoderma gamsii]